MKKDLIILLVFVISSILLLVIMRDFNKKETPPFWYVGNQLDWEHDHYITPEGADEISNEIIKYVGLRVLSYNRKKMVVFVLCTDMRYEWEDDKLLVRLLDGNISFFGKIYIHPPLDYDPKENPDKTLRQCIEE